MLDKANCCYWFMACSEACKDEYTFEFWKYSNFRSDQKWKWYFHLSIKRSFLDLRSLKNVIINMDVNQSKIKSKPVSMNPRMMARKGSTVSSFEASITLVTRRLQAEKKRGKLIMKFKVAIKSFHCFGCFR